MQATSASGSKSWLDLNLPWGSATYWERIHQQQHHKPGWQPQRHRCNLENTMLLVIAARNYLLRERKWREENRTPDVTSSSLVTSKPADCTLAFTQHMRRLGGALVLSLPFHQVGISGPIGRSSGRQWEQGGQEGDSVDVELHDCRMWIIIFECQITLVLRLGIFRDQWGWKISLCNTSSKWKSSIIYMSESARYVICLTNSPLDTTSHSAQEVAACSVTVREQYIVLYNNVYLDISNEAEDPTWNGRWPLCKVVINSIPTLSPQYPWSSTQRDSWMTPVNPFRAISPNSNKFARFTLGSRENKFCSSILTVRRRKRKSIRERE